MVSIPSLCKSQELVISVFKTRRKLEVSEDVIQSLQIVNTSNMRHIDHDCLINSLSSENQNQFLSKTQFSSRVDCKFNKSVFNHAWNKFINLNEQQLLLCHN